MNLSGYITRTQQLLKDPTSRFYSQSDLTTYINIARGQVAQESMSVRVLPPSANVGENQTVASQEVYPFSAVNTVISNSGLYPGVQGVIGVITIAVNVGAIKPTLRERAWSELQACFRAYNVGLTGWPTDYAQYGQGASGSVYVWPIPSSAYPWDWDCYCQPIDLQSDADVEAIPYPWTDAVPYFAASLAFDNSQRPQDSDRMMQKYQFFMNRGTAGSKQIMFPDFYNTR